jgi:hypothetical protein
MNIADQIADILKWSPGPDPVLRRRLEAVELEMRSAPCIDTVVDAVRADLLRRSQIGIAKYGVTLDRTDLTLRDWLQHAYEETLDQANYLKRAIMEIDQFDQPPKIKRHEVVFDQSAIDAVRKATG